MKSHKFAFLVASACACLASFTGQAQTRILPFGDSVTSSMAPHNSYRYWLWHMLVNAGFDVDFVGTQYGVADGAPANSDFDQNHEGHPGWTTWDALNTVDSVANATHPDIVLLDFGANDVQSGLPIETIIATLQEVIHHFQAINPNVTVLVAQPTPYTGENNRNMSRLKGAIGKLAKTERQAGGDVRAVNLFGGFSTRRDTVDGTHPNELGEQKIARKYFQAIRKELR
jgi:lysophospholipase L1-like esterase